VACSAADAVSASLLPSVSVTRRIKGSESRGQGIKGIKGSGSLILLFVRQSKKIKEPDPLIVIAEMSFDAFGKRRKVQSLASLSS
jgi:hypothetical protein